MAERRVSGPISAISSSSVRVATLVIADGAKPEPGGAVPASKAIPIAGRASEMAEMMDRLREHAAGASLLEDVVDVTRQLHRDALSEAGFTFNSDGIDEGPDSDPDPGSDTGLSLQIFDLLRSGQKLLGPLTMDQRRGLGLVARAFTLQGRMSVRHHDSRLQGALDNAERAGAVGKANSQRSAEAAAARYRAAVAEACRLWAAGSRLGHVRMADRLLAMADHAGLQVRRLRAALKPHALRK